MERLEREAKEPPGLPDPDAITASAFRIPDLLTIDLDRARSALVGWLNDGQIRVQKTPAGFKIQGAYYPLLLLDTSPKIKPKDSWPLGCGLPTISSGGGI